MIVALASGKGGTGKTLVSTCLAWLMAREGHRVTYVDADVEEPNGHLFLHPEIEERRRFTRTVPELRGERCSGCGDCQRFCRFNAIIALRDRALVFPELCSSCGGCLRACREGALVEVPREIGTIEKGIASVDSRHSIRFLSATLDVGVARPTPLIRGLLDQIEDEGIVLVDAPPGTSCSVREVVKEVDRVVLVTEPTPFGLYDLRLAVELARVCGKQVSAVVNRADLGDESVRRYLESEQVELVSEIGFSPGIAAAYAGGEIAVASNPGLSRLLEPLGRSLIEESAP